MKDIFGDEIVVRSDEDDWDRVSLIVWDGGVQCEARLTGRMARKLAKKLIRAADAVEERVSRG